MLLGEEGVLRSSVIEIFTREIHNFTAYKSSIKVYLIFNFLRIYRSWPQMQRLHFALRKKQLIMRDYVAYW